MAKILIQRRDDSGRIEASNEYEMPIEDLRFFMFLFHETLLYAIKREKIEEDIDLKKPDQPATPW